MSENIQPKRVLHVVSAMHRGGAETMIMNLYRKMDRSKIQFDFISHSKGKSDYDDEIESLGGRIFKCSSLGQSKPIKYIKDLTQIIKNNGPFVAVHAHTDFQAGFVAIAARLAKVKVRLCHSHNTVWKFDPSKIDCVMHSIYRQLIKFNATSYCACSNDAGIFMFGQKNVDLGKVTILPNGIDVEKFSRFCTEDKDFMRKELNIPDDSIVIGHIGRFYKQKNHAFLIKLARYLKENKINFVMLLVGDGPLREEIGNNVEIFDLKDNIRFLGVREDIDQLLKVFDIFLLPSLFEGLPLVLVEAQASGVPSIVAETLTSEVDMGLGLISFLGTSEKDVKKWSEAIKDKQANKRPNEKFIADNFRKRGYDVKQNISTVTKIYGLNN